jgi:MFS family permease
MDADRPAESVRSERGDEDPPAGNPERRSLWRNRDFVFFWSGETASQVGSQVTFVALPLVALLTLDAGADELGLLRFVEYLPFLLFTLPFGVLADRRSRRTLMMCSYLISGVAVGMVPLLSVAGLLRFEALAVCALVVGVGAALFDVCWMSYVPGLVERDRLVEAMGKMATSHSAAEVAGPGIGGLLVQLVSAPLALALDALSYVAGVLSLLAIRHREPPPVPSRVKVSLIVAELGQGLRFAFTERHIRATAYAAAIANYFAVITETAFLLYAVHDRNLGPGLIGLVFTAVGVGGVVGASVANTIIRRWPLGSSYVGARIVGGLAAMLLPLASGPSVVVVALSMASFFFVQAALANTNVVNASLRQVLTPDRIRGRMNASVRTLVFGVMPLAGPSTAVCVHLVGLRGTLWLGAAGYAASIVPILASPIPRLVTMPSGRPDRGEAVVQPDRG